VVPTDDAAAIRRRFDVPAGATTVVLVGKDGGEKFRADGPVPPQRLFTLIDAMPMRQDEMRAQRGE
jgi:hypothetical protein